MKNITFQKVLIIAILISCLLKTYPIQGQNQNVFEMAHSMSNTIGINRNFSKSVTIYPFSQFKGIFSLSITAKINLINFNSLVRVILITDLQDEYLISESSNIFSEENPVILKSYSEETCLLNGVIPKAIKLEIVDATISIESISFNDDVVNKQNEAIFLDNFKLNKKEQDSIKIERINNQLKKNGFRWYAAETNISQLTYQQKKYMMGDTVPNLKGLEYYSGGIFDLSDPKNVLLSLNAMEERNIASSFTWRNRHGTNWITPVRDQGTYNTCWSFGRIGAVEAIVNLYWNQHFNLDLSEQQLIRCTGGGDVAFEFIKNNGVVLESCSPYNPSDYITPCSTICTNPIERIRIEDFYRIQHLSEDSLKRSIIKCGPQSILLGDLMHEMTLVGFGIINENDTIEFVDSGNHNFSYDIILPGDNLIGTKYWIFKNSWGATSSYRRDGYVLLKTEINNLFWIKGISPPIYSLQYTDADIKCVDSDGDGYFNWGIGEKPTTCLVCPIQEDGDDSNPLLGPLDPEDLSISANVTYYYSFESNSDLWVQSNTDDFNWHITNQPRGNPNPNTGPISASDGSYFLLANAYMNAPSKIAVISGPSINLLNSCNASLRFDYHMYGATMGTLAVQISTDGGNVWSSNIWSISGNQGDSWHNCVIDISTHIGEMLKFRFVATTGSSAASNIAIDNIKIIPANPTTNLVITTNQTWLDFRNLCQNIIIQNNAILTIKGEVIMPDQSLITIKTGSELVIDAGQIINSKILVESGGKLTVKNNGILLINNDDITVNLGGLLDFTSGDIKKRN